MEREVVATAEAEAAQTTAVRAEADLDQARASLQRARAQVDEADVGLVQADQRATFEVSAWPGREFEATFQSLALQPTLTDNVVTYIAELTVEHPEYLLRPGMTASANIITGEQNGILRVPNSALRFEPPVVEESSGSALVPQFGRRSRPRSEAEGIGTVHVLKGGQPVAVRVNTGRTDGRFTAIESEEISEGTQIVVGFTEGPLDEVAWG